MLSRREFLKMAAAGTFPLIFGIGCEEKERDEYKGPKIEFHVHPYLNNYSLDDVIDKAIEKNIKVLCLEAYNSETFQMLLQESKKSKYKIDADSIAISVDESRLYILRATEVMTRQGFHLLLVGDYKIKHAKSIEEAVHAEEAIEKSLENNSIVIFDHPFVRALKPWKDIRKDKEKEVEKICKKYGKNIFLEWNSYLLPYMRLENAKKKQKNLHQSLTWQLLLILTFMQEMKGYLRR